MSDCSDEGGIQIHIAHINGRNYILPNVKGTETLLELKKRIELVIGMMSYKQILIYQGERMEDNGQLLRDYHVYNNCCIHLVAHSVGGYSATR